MRNTQTLKAAMCLLALAGCTKQSAVYDPFEDPSIPEVGIEQVTPDPLDPLEDASIPSVPVQEVAPTPNYKEINQNNIPALFNRIAGLEGKDKIDYDANGNPISRYGIDIRYNPNVDLNTLTKDQAQKIFQKKYMFSDMNVPSGVFNVLSDGIYQAGRSGGNKMGQRVVGAKPDGIWGPKSSEALNNYLAEHGEDGFIKAFQEERANTFRNTPRYQQQGILKGMLNRAKYDGSL